MAAAARWKVSGRTVCMAAIAFAPLAWSAEWQWSVPVRNSRENPGVARAWLWIPPTSERLRGAVVAQHNMEEISILEHPRFRAALSELNFAEVWVAPPFDHLFRFSEGAGETFDGMIDDLARVSGYDELRFAPVVGLGHSAAASWPYYFAAWNPERTLAAISVSGQWPYFRSPAFAPDIWGERTIDFVPCLETMGEYEAANTWSREGLKERREHPRMPLSMLACPGEGHFASSDAKVEFLALYLRKAVQYRVPKDWTAEAPPKLIPIDPTKTGWLAEKWRQDQAPTAAAAPVGQYQGDPGEAFWHFDAEIARAVERHQAQHRGQKPQLVGFVQEGQFVPQQATHLQVRLAFLPQEDGVTFRLGGAFYDTVPDGSPRLPQWAGLPVGSPLGHAGAGGPVSIERICGPFAKLGPDTFSLQFQKETRFAGREYELVLAATHPGDQDYKPAVQQAHLLVPARNAEGLEQRIMFLQPADVKRGTETVPLTATADAGLPVCFCVREGPAEVEGNMLKLKPIPPRAKFPVKVTIVAWQYGRRAAPKIQSAEPVERSFFIRK